MRKVWQTSKVEMGKESIKLVKSHTQKGGYSKCIDMSTRERRWERGGGVEKSVIKYVRTKWMAPNKYCGIFFVHWSGQVH